MNNKFYMLLLKKKIEEIRQEEGNNLENDSIEVPKVLPRSFKFARQIENILGSRKRWSYERTIEDTQVKRYGYNKKYEVYYHKQS